MCHTTGIALPFVFTTLDASPPSNVMLPRRKMAESVLNICSSVAVGMSRADKAIWETQEVRWGG